MPAHSDTHKKCWHSLQVTPCSTTQRKWQLVPGWASRAQTQTSSCCMARLWQGPEAARTQHGPHSSSPELSSELATQCVGLRNVRLFGVRCAAFCRRHGTRSVGCLHRHMCACRHADGYGHAQEAAGPGSLRQPRCGGEFEAKRQYAHRPPNCQCARVTKSHHTAPYWCQCAHLRSCLAACTLCVAI